MKRRSENYFIPVLAFFDLLASVTCSGTAISDNMEYVTYPSDFLCKFLLFAGFYLTGTSASLLLAIAIQRYLKICRPLRSQMTLKWRRFAIAAVIFANFVYFSPVLLVAKVSPVVGNYHDIKFTGNSCLTGTGASPTFEKVYYVCVFIVVILNICFTIGFYAPIGCFLYKRTKRLQSFRSSSQVEREDNISVKERSTASMTEAKRLSEREKSTRSQNTSMTHAQSRFNAMLTIIIVVYVISYVPTCIVMLYCEVEHNFWFSLSSIELQVFVGLQKALIINHIANPIIYGFFDMNFRNEVLKLIKCKMNCAFISKRFTSS
ncbi:hypothetical protein FSP39_000107 [Pinctada imbricata]|uniref:G-protein coupled receptors family 1 profile domain-containing protein n=1 Tax=Pinctada imbricata TaxID=66713 RepID=A0AA88Y9E9_PINIB|nr:hypothetical protein FSP39_000107 [Pinctada imbricata]